MSSNSDAAQGLRPQSPADSGATVTVTNLRSGYAAGPDVFAGVNLTARPGEVTTLLGPNGCGKSTLLRSISRLLEPREGDVKVDGSSVYGLRPKESAQLVALQPQTPIAPDGLTVGELVARGRYPHRARWRGESAHDREVIDAAVKDAELTEFVDRDVASLSGGQRQRAWFAMALAQETPVLLLDEPTTYLDPAHAIDMLNLVKKVARDGRTVVMVLHDLMLAGMFSDRMVMMRDGVVICDGNPAEVLTPANLESVYGLDAEIIDDAQGGYPIIVPRGSANGRVASEGC